MYHGLYDQIVSDLSMDNHFQCVRWAIVDVEVGMQDHKIHDIGALRCDGAVYHQASKTHILCAYTNQRGGRDTCSFIEEKRR